MKFFFHSAAEQEFNEAIDYYESITPGLGRDFAKEVHAAIERAIDFPKAWPLLRDDVRRSLVRRFPYGVLYAEEKEGIMIVAVMNLNRRPGYWSGRR